MDELDGCVVDNEMAFFLEALSRTLTVEIANLDRLFSKDREILREGNEGCADWATACGGFDAC
jgi:hypothetical protein